MARTKRIKKPTEAVAPDGSVMQGTTQTELNNRLEDYKKENEAYYEQKRTKKIWDTTADEIFKQALDKFSKDPTAFTADQITALKNAGVSLWYGKPEGAPATPQQTQTNPQQTTPQQANQTQTNQTQTQQQPTVPMFPTLDEQKKKNGSQNDRNKQGGINSFLGYMWL